MPLGVPRFFFNWGNLRMPKIGVCMIVKNESGVIVRCLDSVKKFASFVCVEDTGSADGTQDIIRNWLTDNQIEGEVYDRLWVNFADNRSSVLKRLRTRSDVDYSLIIDADDEFQIDDETAFQVALSELKHDAYRIKLRGQEVEYYRIQCVRNSLDFYYRGVLHEFIEGPQHHSVSELKGCSMRSNREGARSADPLKYKKDADLLQHALAHERDEFLISRYTFYLAQSYRDSGQSSKAIECYLRRADQAYWIEERYVALYQAASLMEKQDIPDSALIEKTYRRALELIPHRAEVFHALSRFMRLKKNYLEAIRVGMRGLSLAKEIPEGLFVETWIYEYGLLDELVVSNYWAGAYQNSLDLSMKLMGVSTLPASLRERIWKNARFSQEKLREKLFDFDRVERDFLSHSVWGPS